MHDAMPLHVPIYLNYVFLFTDSEHNISRKEFNDCVPVAHRLDYVFLKIKRGWYLSYLRSSRNVSSLGSI